MIGTEEGLFWLGLFLWFGMEAIKDGLKNQGRGNK